MTRLWRRMAALYGEGRWLAHAPEHVMDDWAEVLGRRTLADIARGLSRLETTPGEFPPGAAKFREVCREFQPGTFAGGRQVTHDEGAKSVVELLQGATVTGSARAYLDMCQRITEGHRLTREQLEALPPIVINGGVVVRPAAVCVAADDPA